LSREKGFDVLLRALAACIDIPWCLEVLGQGPEETQLRALARSLGLCERVRWAGFVANPYPWLRAADALLLSSRYEGLPNVVLEALACGTPVIATPVPSALEIMRCVCPSEAIEVANGFDTESLAAAIRRWTTTPGPRVDPSTVEPYAVGPVVRRYEEALRHAAVI
jgi:glycosyltransferase involved in cell wall biosynthesis